MLIQRELLRSWGTLRDRSACICCAAAAMKASGGSTPSLAYAHLKSPPSSFAPLTARSPNACPPHVLPTTPHRTVGLTKHLQACIC